MDAPFGGSETRFDFNFSVALGLAQLAHDAALESPGVDVFSKLNLDRDRVARELPSLACVPGPLPKYSSAPVWKIWQDF